MTTYNAGDTLPARDITDDLIGAEIEFPHRGAAVVGKLADSRQDGEWSVLYFGKLSVGFVIPESQVVTVLTPPPAKAIQPDEPTALGTLVRIEGEEGQVWVLFCPDAPNPYMFISEDGARHSNGWLDIVRSAAGRQIVVSSAPQFPTPETPETITEWPGDDTALRGWRWRDRDGHYWEYLGGQWRFSMTDGVWDAWYLPALSLPLTRVGRA